MKKVMFSGIVICCGIILLAATGCQKQPLNNLSNEESRIYITNYDTSANFRSYQTFSIVDSVAVLSNGSSQDRELTQADAMLLQKITSLMEQRGYKLVNKSQNPDLAINVTKVSNTFTGVQSYPDYWNYYYDNYWNPYYWGYPGYDYYFPQTYVFYQYSQGYLSIDMLDLKNASKNNNQLTAIWNAQFKGENVDDSSVVSNEVQQAFDQSPYLTTSN